jgi:hypothetical protein
MKKFLLTISAVFLIYNAMAQLPADRTVQTVVADALAQLPAKDQKQYDQLMKDLVATGEEGILLLTSKLNAPGKGSNAATEYALSGIAHYTDGNANEETLRVAISGAFVKALNATEVKENKQFIISLLQIVGKDEAVDMLAPLLGNPDLSDNAARALASIKTEKAGKALQTALLRKTGTPETLQNIVLAVGEIQSPDSEELLLTLLSTDNEALKKDLFWSLSRTGGASSIAALAAEAEKAGFKYEKTNATEAYLAVLLKNIKENAQTVSAAALKILKTAPENAYAARIAALQIYTCSEREFNEEKVWKEIIAALKSDNKPYRVAALENTLWLQRSAIKNHDKTLKKLLKKEKDPERQSELIHAIANIAFADIKHTGIASERVGDLFATIQPYLQNENSLVRKTAIQEIGSLTSAYPDHHDYIRQLVSASDSEDKDIVNTGIDILKSIKSDKLTDAINETILQVNDNTKIAFLNILASRKATKSLKNVLSLIRSGSPEVKTAALKTLKDVVTTDDLETLASMAESADKQDVPYIQQAGIAALSSLPVARQINFIKEGMSRAGAKKYLYYLPLASTGDPQAVSLIKEGFASSNKDVKDAAFDALLNWNGADVASLIFDVCKDPSADEYFNRAFDAYIKKISNNSLSGENRLIFLREAMEIAKTDEQKNLVLKQIKQTGTYLALLYAGEFLNVPALKENAAQAVMTIALNHKYTGENVVALLNKTAAALSNPDADYQRQSIEKHLEELPPEKGFISLFNGKDLTGWKGLLASPNDNPLKRAKLKPKELAAEQAKADEQMRKDWIVENGLLAYIGHSYNNLCTERKYGDFEMYVDWMLDPAGPEADAGIYLRGTPQVQIWDIARTDVGAQVGSGGLYNNKAHQSKPLKVADNKLGTWNTLYIKMIGDHVTVKLNGELVVDNVILENYWERNLPIPDFEQIELQAHGSKVYYRNIYIKELERPKPFELSAQEKKEGFQILFDGTNMHEWTGNLADYQLEDGCISVHPTSSFGGNLYTKKEYDNFAFRFEFQLTPAANNGVGIRASMEGDNAYNAMEIQILDCEHPVYKDIMPYQHHGSVYGVIAAEHGAMKPTGEWNEEEIYANGDHIRVTLNGKVILDGNIRQATKNGAIDNKEHPGLFNKSGHIGFLGHGNELKFRNIRIKEL